MTPIRFSYRLVCFFLLLSFAVPARAQTIPAAIAPAAPVPAGAAASGAYFTRADTARAIRKLFRGRRGGGIGWLAFGTAGILASTLPAQQSTSAGVWTPGVVAGSALMLLGLNKRIQFRPGRERQVLRELAATGHLSRGVARRLRGKFRPVQGSESDYNPLLAKGIAPHNPMAALTPVQAQAAARADTLRAINRLFQRRRKGGRVWAYIGVSGALSMLRLLATPANDDNSASGGGIAAVAVTFIGVPMVASIANLAAYSEVQEAAVDQSYRAGQPLPKKIRQRMKRKDLESYD